MREILLEMGFEELYGGIVQQSFWNFDRLFQPRTTRTGDAGYILSQGVLPLPPGYEKVKAMHESAGVPHRPAGEVYGKRKKPSSACFGPIQQASQSSTLRKS